MPQTSKKIDAFSQIGMLIKERDASSRHSAIQLIEALLQKLPKLKISLEPSDHKILPAKLKQRVTSSLISKMIQKQNLIISVGGDGTILRCARHLLKNEAWRSCRVLGVNQGHMGFLSFLTEKEALKNLYKYLEKPHLLAEEPHACLDVELSLGGHAKTKHFHVLNDCVLSRGRLSKISEYEIELNDRFLSSYRADGLIVSPPTGSTAYNLAAGGSIIQPGIPAIQITPICPQHFSTKPIVIADHHHIRVRLGARARHVYMTLDGHDVIQLSNKAEVHITKSIKSLKFLVPRAKIDSHYFDSLRQKLNWGLEPRAST